MKNIFLVIPLLILLTACTSNTPSTITAIRTEIVVPAYSTSSPATDPSDRKEIIKWASEIAALQIKMENDLKQIQPTIDKVTKNRPTELDLNRLRGFSNNIVTIFNIVNTIDAPKDVESTHKKYVEMYTRLSDYARYYYLAISQNNMDYFNKSILAVEDANRLNNETYSEFEEIINYFAIPCEEINFCE